MASSPWSVKGVDADAREAAKLAAKARGMTLGEWLSAVIEETGEAVPPPAAHRPTYSNGYAQELAPTPSRPRARQDVEGLTHAIEALSRRLEASETRSALSFTGFDRSVMELAAKVENAERGTGAASSRIGGLVEDLRATQEALAQRLRRLEQSDSSTKNLEALKSLEAALGSLADQVFKQDEAQRKEAEASRQRLDQSLQAFETRFGDLASRVDLTINSAIESTEKAGLRAEGGVREISERVNRLDDRLSEALSAVSDLDERLEALRSSETASDIRTMFEARFDRLTETLDSELAQSRREVSAELEKAALEKGRNGSEQAEAVMERLSGRLDQIEQRHARTVQTLGGEIAKWSGALDRRLGTLEARNDAGVNELAFKTHSEALTARLDARLNDIEAREARVMEAVGKELGRAADTFDQKLGESERHAASAIQNFGEQVSRMAERLKSTQKEALSQIETKLAESQAATQSQISKAVESLTDRLTRVEAKSGGESPLLEESLSRMEQRLNLLEKRVNTAPAPTQRDYSEPAPFEEAFLAPAARAVASAPAPATSARAAAPPPMDAAWADDELDPVDFYADGPANDFSTTDGYSDAQGEDIDEVGTAYVADPMAFSEQHEFDQDEPEPAPRATRAGAAASGSNDYLARARAAALASTDVAPKAKRGSRGMGGGKSQSPERKPRRALLSATKSPIAGRGPLLIAASVAGLLVVGAAATVFMNDSSKPSTDFAMPQYPEAGELQVSQSPMGADLEGAAQADISGELPGLEAETDAGVAEQAPPTTARTSPPRTQPTSPQTNTEANTQAVGPARPVAAQPVTAAAQGTGSAPVARAPQPIQVSTQVSTSREAPSIAASVPQSSPGARVAPPVAEPALTVEVAAGRGDPIAQFMVGTAALDRGDLALGAGMIRRAASAGLPPAQYRLGKLHERGEGVPRDVNEARLWTERAAQGGNIKAMHDLAHLYAEGVGAPQSYATSVEWFRKAADAGLLDSQFNLGVLYEQGLGVTPNLTEALYWFEVSARAGDRDARVRADELRARISPAEAESTVRRAAAFTPQAPNPRANGRFGTQPWDNAAQPASSRPM